MHTRWKPALPSHSLPIKVPNKQKSCCILVAPFLPCQHVVLYFKGDMLRLGLSLGDDRLITNMIAQVEIIHRMLRQIQATVEI